MLSSNSFQGDILGGFVKGHHNGIMNIKLFLLNQTIQSVYAMFRSARISFTRIRTSIPAAVTGHDINQSVAAGLTLVPPRTVLQEVHGRSPLFGTVYNGNSSLRYLNVKTQLLPQTGQDYSGAKYEWPGPVNRSSCYTTHHDRT